MSIVTQTTSKPAMSTRVTLIALLLSRLATLTAQAQRYDYYLDGYKLHQVTLSGAHNTYDKKDEFEYLYHAFHYVQLIEIDVWAHSDKWYMIHGRP